MNFGLPPLRVIVTWALVAFTVYWIIKNPTQAAADARGIGHALSGAAHGLSTFVSHL